MTVDNLISTMIHQDTVELYIDDVYYYKPSAIEDPVLKLQVYTWYHTNNNKIYITTVQPSITYMKQIITEYLFSKQQIISMRNANISMTEIVNSTVSLPAIQKLIDSRNISHDTMTQYIINVYESLLMGVINK